MLDCVSVLTRGGLVLWSYCFSSSIDKNSVLSFWVSKYLVEEKGGDLLALVTKYTLRWKFINEINSICVIVYQGAEPAEFIDALLTQICSQFLKQIDNFDINSGKKIDFDSNLLKILRTTEKTKLTLQHSKQNNQNNSSTDDRSSGKKTGRLPAGQRNTTNKTSSLDADDLKKKGGQDVDPLDFSKKMEAQDTDENAPKIGTSPTAEAIGATVDTISNPGDDFDIDALSENEDEERFVGKLWSIFKSKIYGNKVLNDEDLRGYIATLKQKLIAKNVAVQVTDSILKSVENRLHGTKTAKWTSASLCIRMALKDSLKQILAPKSPFNLMREVRQAKAASKVYKIVFLGVNGVGKSTSLSKICSMLKKEFSVLIAACDTFRSGAVEQLKKHADTLGVDLYSQGYGKDPESVAKYAIAHATKNGHDVVLIDTAGRMQDNTPLMQALRRVIEINDPDLVMFVGEALVGNDAVEQITSFNSFLKQGNGRGIDGIFLTKFDTVDDKVGAAVSMSYLTGQAILFVGNGQTYQHLKRLSVNEVVDSLLR